MRGKMLQYLEINWVKVWEIRERGDRCLVKSVKIMWRRKRWLVENAYRLWYDYGYRCIGVEYMVRAVFFGIHRGRKISLKYLNAAITHGKLI